MIVAGIGCLLAVLQSPASDSLRLLALSLPQTSLVVTVRQRPLAVRDAITDSMRRVGIKAFGAEGPHAAVQLWQRALTRAATNGDSAGMAALLGNIGAGLLED